MSGWGRLLCCVMVVVSMSGQPAAQIPDKPTYAVIGSEASGLLPLFVDTRSIITVRVGDLASVLTQTSVTAVIVPEAWSNTLDIQAAEAAHLKIVHLKRHNTIAHIFANVRTVARLVTDPSAGERMVRRMQTGLAQVRAAYGRAAYADATPVQAAQVRAALVRVMLLTPEGYTEGQGTLLTELLAVAGGVNVAAEACIPEARQISDTQIREFAPQVVLLLHWTADEARTFAKSVTYQGIPAFDAGRIVRIAPLGKYPAALVQDAQQLAVILQRGRERSA